MFANSMSFACRRGVVLCRRFFLKSSCLLEQDSHSGHVIKVTGLPYDQDKRYVHDLFVNIYGCKISGGKDGIHLQYNVNDPKWRRKNLPAQVAFLQLASQLDQEKILDNTYSSLMPKRMKVLKSTQAELDWSINRQLTDRTTKHTVWLSGLPYGVTEEQIHLFLQPLIPADVTSFGQGDALVDFETHSDAEKARSKDREYIGNRYVRVTNLTSPQEEEEEFKWPAPIE